MYNAAFVILGATGDLSRHRLFPAFYQLYTQKALDNWVIVGAASSALSRQEFHALIRTTISIDDEHKWQEFSAHIFYQQLYFEQLEDFNQLNQLVKKQEGLFNTQGNRLVYLAAAAHFFCVITRNCGLSGLLKRESSTAGWQRIIYEKPFGNDLASARSINACIQDYFDEKQVYRIDHYLTKELVSNIALMRFTNIIFEPLWNSHYIEYVSIDLSETIGVRDRGRYYDHYGVLKDVVQNHVLQLLTLIAMEAPERLTGDFIRDKKAEVLKSVRAIDGILGQYEGYHNEKDIAHNSQTPTFALLTLHVDTVRWKEVPFYIRAGKKLATKNTAIIIKFRPITCPLKGIQECPSNYLTMRISPDAIFSLKLNVKPVGASDRVTSVAMEFCHSYLSGPTTQHAYEILLKAIMKGEESVSVRFDEIELAWRVIEGIEQLQLKQYTYQPGTKGPHYAELFAQERGIKWE